MIRNIVFDLGGVLVDFDREYFLNAFNVAEKDKKILMNEVFLSKEWSMMDKGTLDEEGAYNRVIKNIPSHLHDKAYDLIFNWEEVVKPIEGINEYINDLKQRGFNIYLLSNTSRRFLNKYWPTLKVHELFDGEVVSAFVGLIKPQDEIYQHLLNKYNLKAEECVFIDDLPVNICGAEYNGIKGIVFHKDIDELKEKLETIVKETK